MVEHGPVGIGREGDQQIDVAVGPQVAGNGRAEDGQPSDLPAGAELLDLLL